MYNYIALLRGINVSGQKKIKMADLRSLMEKHGYHAVQTYIQSGNIVFQSTSSEPSVLEKKIADILETQYGFSVKVLIKTPKELAEAIAQNPFHERQDVDTKRLYLTLLDTIPDRERIEALHRLDYHPEEYVLQHKNVYFYSPNGYGRAKMNNNFFEQKLKVNATTRNWKTMNKLLEMVRQADKNT